MKSNIFFTLLLFFIQTAYAQELTVKQLTVAGNDISASQYRRDDSNGQPCALVKVSLASPGAVFEGNVIAPVEYKTNEYWVYMTKGSKVLHIRHPNYQTLVVSFPNYGINSLHSLSTYRLYVTMPPVTLSSQKLKVSEETISTVNGVQVNTHTILGVSFNMVCVYGGRFSMGATSEQGKDAIVSDETPIHEVTLSPYFIGETEVTQDLWEAIMGYNPSNYKAKNCPVENVSWEECQIFINKLNTLSGVTFRLPTEAEWEYAARGGQNSQGLKFSGSNNVDSVSWVGKAYTTPHIPEINKKKPNELGLYDMSGNVSEWCLDWYKTGYSKKWQMDPLGPNKGKLRIVRGGDCYSGYIRHRVSSREAKDPKFHSSGIGLRLAASIGSISEKE